MGPRLGRLLSSAKRWRCERRAWLRRTSASLAALSGHELTRALAFWIMLLSVNEVLEFG